MKPAYSEEKPSVLAILVRPDTKPEAYYRSSTGDFNYGRLVGVPTLGSETRRIRVASSGVRRMSAKNLESQHRCITP
jgi:hypothetical protein